MLDMNIETAKQQIRDEVLEKRIATHQMLRDSAALSARDHFLNSLPLSGKAVACYWPLAGELNTVPLMEELAQRGVAVCLPVVEKPDAPLIFRAFKPGDALIEGYSGTKTPAPSAKIVVPDILCVPLVAFDRAGYRLGYGAGFYDRTLDELRKKKEILAVGFAYAVQQVEIVPHEGHDMRLDWVVTERGAMECT